MLALVTTYHNTCKSQLYGQGDENLLTVTLFSCSVSIVNAGPHPHEAGMLRGPTEDIPLLQGVILSVSHETETVASTLAYMTICRAAGCILLHALPDTIAITLTSPALQLLTHTQPDSRDVHMHIQHSEPLTRPGEVMYS